ncbi:tRNA (cytosine(32)/uridine(32)-2'-O)-methyltransferase TrmJ [Amphritea japonica]|uniref:tRNA (cytidine/uridine-2'-O-)-methyltransferase TrmJ n=1 Tax=Amphritea japonica ATCC BAA-1530 TaxID=1278309 RepID=A0A7R6P558_9GAMM|nr:tRNA (cytosine(32)/uridine(32)-2'-O)-methyltransferase TrmJ [Amphritea japonica]BBB27394.1 tRNA (cytidine32/uridine32-2'-O)-methyltransferase [Amphritea japonica ATCC BAA-1530]
MLKNIRIVLVNTSHPGNIGAAARAMKNMGLSDLCLVEPRKFPHRDAEARAAGATDILENAKVVDDLDQALADCQLVVGASARSRTIPWPIVNPRELASIVAPLADDVRVAVLFGREDRGLTNDELQRCHHHVHIPVNEDFSSLNIAAAVQVITYELRMAKLSDVDEAKPQWGTDWDVELADNRELELLFEHLEQTLIEVDFLDPDKPRNLMPRLRRLFMRAIPDKIEVNVLRGMLTAVQKCTKGKES